VTYLRSYVTGSNDAILGVAELRLCPRWGRIKDQEVRWDIALGHLLVLPLGNDSLGV
jgi:hypothetical protein